MLTASSIVHSQVSDLNLTTDTETVAPDLGLPAYTYTLSHSSGHSDTQFTNKQQANEHHTQRLEMGMRGKLVSK